MDWRTWLPAIGLSLLSSAVPAGRQRAESLTVPPEPARPVALYHFDEMGGDRVADSSGHGNDGRILGGATWGRGVRGGAILLNGLNRVQIPSRSSLDRPGPLSVSVWIRGRGGALRFVEGNPAFRGPWFQVCGDRIYLATNTDETPDSLRTRRYNEWRIHEWKDAWHAWTGSADISLTDWQYVQRTREPLSGLEPKLQVVGDWIYYEYFGQDRNKAWQIWTATSALNGAQWTTTQRTDEVSGYRVEQADNIQVADSTVYIGFPRKDAGGRWQLWTASYGRDGSGYRAVQRTTDGGWIPSIQVVGDSVYYMYPVGPIDRQGAADLKSLHFSLYMAVSGRDGTGWRVLRKISDSNFGGVGWGAFQVSNGTIQLAFTQQERKTGRTHLFTGRMDLQGGHLQVSQRTWGAGFTGVPKRSVQVIGDKVYYAFTVWETPETLADLFGDVDKLARLVGAQKRSLWTAESNLDGSGWTATVRPVGGTEDVIWGYRALQLVGAKRYMSAMRMLAVGEYQELLAVAGANVVSKGDAYGVGVTETGVARGFINAGEDYLFRAEAPSDVGGATADAPIDGRWHHLVVTFDVASLRLHLDGVLRATTPYHTPAATNPFPLLIGDGFQGAIDEVAIYDRALSSAEVQDLYRGGT